LVQFVAGEQHRVWQDETAIKMDDDDSSGFLGCLWALLGIGAAIGLVVFLASVDWEALRAAPQASATSGSSSRSTPLTHVGPVSEKQVVEKAADLDPLARKIRTEDDPPPEPPQQTGNIVAMVNDLGALAPPEQALPPVAAAAVQQALANEALCYHGRIARRTRSLFNGNGFAITYGADSYNEGDPLPRLEVFYDFSVQPVMVTVLSLTHKEIPDFPNNHEIPVAYSSEAIGKAIARWTVAVATETCTPPSANAPTKPVQ
jgi:hypothetical protein